MTIRRLDRTEEPETPQESVSPSLEDSISSFSNTFRQVVDRKERVPSKDVAELEAGPSGPQDRYHDEEPTVQHDDAGYAEPPPTYIESVEGNQRLLPSTERTRFRHVVLFVICAAVLAIIVMLQSSSSNTSAPNNQNIPPPAGSSAPTLPSSPEPSRSIILHETSNTIRGTYTLYDLLDVSTSSGSIKLTINLEDANATRLASKPGLVRISSKSGSIKLNFVAPTSTARQNHHIRIESSSGSVSGNIIHGDVTEITTSSGSITLAVTPVSNAAVTTFSTFSTSGSQKVKVNDFAVGGQLTNFKASLITSGSSNIKLELPPDWEGKMHAASGGSGTVKASGNGLHLEQKSQREFIGYKGSAHDLLPIEVQGLGSGNINFTC